MHVGYGIKESLLISRGTVFFTGTICLTSSPSLISCDKGQSLDGVLKQTPLFISRFSPSDKPKGCAGAAKSLHTLSYGVLRYGDVFKSGKRLFESRPTLL
jgi:hypothetical protein